MGHLSRDASETEKFQLLAADDRSLFQWQEAHQNYTAGKMNILMRRIAIIASNVGVVLTPRGAPEVLSTIVYFNRDSYVGEVDSNGLKSGHGILKRANGSVYDGEFIDDLPNGKGKLTYVGSFVYHGEFKDGMMNGTGKYTWPNGSVYEGEYKNDQKHGKGKYTWADGSVYEGEYKNDQKHGKGKYTWADGSVYDGEFKDGTKHGNGKLTFADDSVYNGGFKDGLVHGNGKLTFADRSVYEGESKDCLMNGKGKYTYVDGSVYEGEFKDGKRHGKGKLTSADESVVYDGMWFEDERDQFGLQTRSANANGGGVDVVFTLYQDHIQCGICYNAFTDQTSRDLLPVLGACGHYFCHGCIVRCRFMMGSNGAVGCPKCRKADQFMPGNPVHHIMLIDLLRSARPIDKPSSAGN